MNTLIQKELQNVLTQSMQDTTNGFAGIQLCEQNVPLSDDICTVHTTFEGDHCGTLLLCADTALLNRLARKVLHSESVSLKDVEDVATEYFNIICGRVVAGLFQIARVSSRFQIPQFRPGHYLPDGDTVCRCILNYNGANPESIQLTYISPPSSVER